MASAGRLHVPVVFLTASSCATAAASAAAAATADKEPPVLPSPRSGLCCCSFCHCCLLLLPTLLTLLLLLTLLTLLFQDAPDSRSVEVPSDSSLALAGLPGGRYSLDHTGLDVVEFMLAAGGEGGRGEEGQEGGSHWPQLEGLRSSV